MTYAFYYDVPGDERMYRRVKDGIGAERPAGLLVHLVTATEGGLRHMNVWRSREDWERYRTERVEPVVAAVVRAAGVPAPAGPPEEHGLALVDLEVGDTVAAIADHV